MGAGPPFVDRVPEVLDGVTLGGLRGELGDEVLTELVDLFVSEATGRVEAIAQAVQAEDLDALGRAAHALKGSALNLGARELSELCAFLEERARQGPGDDLAAVVDRAREVRPAMERAAAALRDALRVPRP